MLDTIAWILAGLALAFGLAPLALTARFRRELAALEAQRWPEPTASVAAIVPCKGLDQGFDDNVRAFLSQRHPRLQLLFVVATRDDPAYEPLCRLVAAAAGSRPGLSADVLVAGIEPVRAQKLTNQLRGLRAVAPDVDTLVFLDSDLRPDPGFVSRLVAPLQQPEIGATTGFRWYHPPRPTLGSMLRSTWNAGALPLLTHPSTNFAYGGAMAMRRDSFERGRVAEGWDRALSDDFPFTRAVKALGQELRFVPSCIGISYESSTLAQTIEFTNRQSVISRIYHPPLWWGAAIAHSVANVFVALGLAGLVALALGAGPAAAVLSACLVVLPLQALNALVMFAPLPRLLPQLAPELSRLRPRYVACAPLASVLSLVNTIASLGRRQIVWRGIRYEMVSPTETRILGGH